jgi:hypothetical protein
LGASYLFMVNQLRAWVEGGLTAWAEWVAARPEVREYLLIQQQNDRLYSRASGKYENITTVFNVLATFNPLSRILGTMPEGYAPAIEVAYHFCRWVDDVADGDMPLPEPQEDFASLVEALKAHLSGCSALLAEDTDLEFLLKRTLQKLDKHLVPSIDARKEMGLFLDAMRVEHDKRVEGVIFSRVELEALYKDSFGPPHMLAFAALGSNCSGEAIADLFQLQGRLYAVRDLTPELSKGIVFIPLEVVEESGLSQDALIGDPETAVQNEVIQRWIAEEDRYGLQTIAALREKARSLPWDVKGVVEFLVKPIEVNIRIRRATS